MFFTGFKEILMGNFHWLLMGNMSWKSHEKNMKKTLKIQRFMAHEKTLTNKNPMKMPWNRMKLFFHGVEIYGFLMGLLNSCLIKKPWFIRERSKINGFWWHFHYPWIMALAYFSWERQRQGYHENLVLNYSPLLN